jgi:carboxymethylenebutenolidase
MDRQHDGSQATQTWQLPCPFTGVSLKLNQCLRSRLPLLLHYAGLDTRVNAGWPAYEEALKANNKEYKAYVYPDVNHGFHNDSTPRYDKAAAELAWKRTIDFFKEKLG